MNSDIRHFCTCRDIQCGHNPNNPNGKCHSCDACVKKNLDRGEIPSCFFRKVKDDLAGVESFTFESFMKFFSENGK